jgi:hypothetical protein
MTTYTANTECTFLEDIFYVDQAIVDNMPLFEITFKEYSSPETRWEPAYYNLEIHNIEIQNKEDYTSEQLDIINEVIINNEEKIIECFEADMLDPSNYWE